MTKSSIFLCIWWLASWGPLHKPWLVDTLREGAVSVDSQVQPRSQGPLSSSLEKVPWLRLVTCLCIQIKSVPRMGLWLNFINAVYGGESCAALQTLFWKLSKLFVRDPAWPVLPFYLNFYEYEMLIEREVCLFSLLFQITVKSLFGLV